MYVEIAGTDYVCGDCAFLNQSQCELMPLGNDLVSPRAGGCNNFTYGGADGVNVVPQSRDALGYLENHNGFGCRRCEEFKPEGLACKKVDKNSAGAGRLGAILPIGCCNFWQRDPRRGTLSNQDLVREIGPAIDSAYRKRDLVRG